MSKKDTSEAEPETLDLEGSIDEFDWEEDEPKISRENARKQLIPFLKRCNVNPKKIKDPEKKEPLVNCISRLTDEIMSGGLEVEEIDGEFQVTQHLKIRSKGSTVDKIVFGEYRGSNHRDMDPEDGKIQAMLSIMEKVSKTQDAKVIIDQMRSSDLDLLETLSVLFS